MCIRDSILSLIATGTPASGPVNVPSSMSFCTSAARFIAPSSSTVTKLCTASSLAAMASKAALVASSTAVSYTHLDVYKRQGQYPASASLHSANRLH